MGSPYYEANKERIKARSLEAYYANRESRIEYQRAYYRKNRERCLEGDARRRARAGRRRQRPEVARRAKEVRADRLIHPVADTEIGRFLFGVFRDQRKLLTRLTGEQHHIDHIVPLFKGGENAPWNLRVITARENLTRKRID